MVLKLLLQQQQQQQRLTRFLINCTSVHKSVVQCGTRTLHKRWPGYTVVLVDICSLQIIG
jgi:hypothetical protein